MRHASFMKRTASMAQTAASDANHPVPPNMDEDAAWRQLISRDRAASFLYGVTTTGVFCRPGCASRRPKRENVRFFTGIEQAVAAGFRACLRCCPESEQPMRGAVDRVRRYLESHLDRRVPLTELGRIAGLSPFTVQRAFKQQMGVSPLAYQRALRSGEFRTALKKGVSVTNAVYEAGFGSASRAYEGAQLGMTPARFAAGGKGERIRWAVAPSGFGWIILGTTERGICWLALTETAAAAEESLRSEFPAATLQPDETLQGIVSEAVASVETGNIADGLTLDLRGTAFQLRVWQALRAIPRGETRTYGQLAREMGIPDSTRAVARACALNRVSVLVPCHRVVGASGSLTGYRWGVERKQRLLSAERAR